MARAPSAFLMTMKVGKNGQPYQHYLKDANGQRIPREKATAEQLAQAKNGEASTSGAAPQAKRQSEYLMVKKLAKNGTIYQHYLKDASGQKILRATATEEQIAMSKQVQNPANATPEQKARRAKNLTKKINKIVKAKNAKHKIPSDITASLALTFDRQSHARKDRRDKHGDSAADMGADDARPDPSKFLP